MSRRNNRKEEEADDEEELVFDRNEIKKRAVVQQEVVIDTTEKEEEKNQPAIYNIDDGSARIIDGAFQINFIVDDYEFKDVEEHVIIPKGCLAKFHVSVDMPKTFECGFTFEDKDKTVSEILTKGDTWFYLFDTVGDIEFGDDDNDELGCIVTVLDIDETDKKIAKQTEKARKKYHKWCDRREKEQKKKEQKENAQLKKQMKIEEAAEKRYLKDAEKVAKKEAKKVNGDFNFEVSNDDVQRQQAVSESLAMFNAMRESKLQG